MGTRQEELSAVNTGRSSEKLEELNPQELVNMAWTFSALGTRQAERSLARLDGFIPKNLANTARAFARLGVRRESRWIAPR